MQQALEGNCQMTIGNVQKCVPTGLKVGGTRVRSVGALAIVASITGLVCSGPVLALSDGVDSTSPASTTAEADLIGVADPGLRLYWPQEKMCGPVAVYVALRDYGLMSDFSKVARALPVGENGSSMQECSAYLSNHGLHTLCVSLTGVNLETLLCHHPSLGAVVLVDGDHWLYVRSTDGKQLRCFEYPRWQTSNEIRLIERCSGPAIIVGEESAIRQLFVDQVAWWSSLTFGAASTVLLCSTVFRKRWKVQCAPS